MFKHLIKGLLSALTVSLLDNYRHLSVRLLRIESTKSYVRGVQMIRLSALGLLRMWLVVALICLGVILVHVCLFVLLPLSVKAKAFIGLFLGLGYILLGCLAIRAAMDEGAWMDKSGASDMVKKALQPYNKD